MVLWVLLLPHVCDSDFSLDDMMIGPYGGINLRSESPLLVVTEAKRNQTLQLSSSEAEVLGLMRALMTK